MKKVGLKHLRRTIRKTGASFFATAFVVAISICAFVGMQSSSKAIETHAANYFAENNLETFEVSCANGITQEDVDAIAGWDGITAVEGGYTASILLEREHEAILVLARSLLDEINTPMIIEGTLPSSPGEAAIEESLATKEGVSVGDVITLEHDGQLLSDTFTVSAIINLPTYCCANFNDTRGTSEIGLGSNEYFVALTKDAFDSDYFSGCFTAAYAVSSALDGVYYFSSDYAEQEEAYLQSLDGLAQERAQLRYESLTSDAQSEIDDAQAEIDDAQAQLDDAQAEIDDAQAEIDSGEEELLSAQEEIDANEQTLADAQAEYDEQAALLASSLTQLQEQLSAAGMPTDLDQALEQIDGQLSQLEATLGQLQALAQADEASAQMLEQLTANSAALKTLQATILAYQDGERQLESGAQELESSRQQLEDAKAELEAARAELDDAKAEIEDARAEVASKQLELGDAKETLAGARDDASQIALKKWIFSERNSVGDVRAISYVTSMLNVLSLSLSLVFLLVACVISYTSATRMINEQITLVGTQKAMGFTRKEIFRHYLLYNLCCAVFGVVLGTLLAVLAIEPIVLLVFHTTFAMGAIPCVISWPETLLSAVLFLFVFTLVTFVACGSLLKQPATTLLRGGPEAKVRHHRFESWKSFRKLNLYTRSMIKNVLNDKGRALTTIFGVIGSVSLLVICLSLKLGIDNAAVVQLEKYAFGDGRLAVDSSVGSLDTFAETLEEQGVSFLQVHDKLTYFRAKGGDWLSTYILATDQPEALTEYYYLEDIDTKQAVSVPEEGFLVTRKVSELYGLSAGSTVELMNSNGDTVEGTVAGVIESYYSSHLFLSTKAYYESVMGEEADPSVFWFKGDPDAVRSATEGLPGFVTVKEESDFTFNMPELTLVVIVCFIVSLLMTIFVLTNQIVLQINKRARELAVMRINGYTLKETKAYIYKDNIVLTLIGLILGCAVGCIPGYLTVVGVEADARHFVRSINPYALLIAFVCGALFSLVVNIVALRKVNRLNLTNVSSN